MTRRGLLASLALSAAVLTAAWLGQTLVRTIEDLEVGDCFTLPVSGWDGPLSAVDVINCDDALDAAAKAGTVIAARVDLIGNLAHESPLAFPGGVASAQLATRWCDQRSGTNDLVAIAPDEAAWAAGAPVVCLRLGR